MNVNEPRPWLETNLASTPGWLVKLASWYESDWQQLVRSSTDSVVGREDVDDLVPDRPSVDALIEQLPEDRQQVARSTLRSIDQFYRQTVRSGVLATEPTKIKAQASFDQPTSESISPAMKVAAESEFATALTAPEALRHDVETMDSAPSVQPPLQPVDHSVDGETLDGAASPRDGTPASTPIVRSGSALVGQPDAIVDFSVGSLPIGGGGKIVRSGKHSGESIPIAKQAMVVGQVMGDYRIERVLGKGGMGVVYLATQQKLDRLVALKMILGGAGMRQSMLDRFDAEAKAIARFQHENIVRIFETGQHNGMPYFSLEFIDGPTLSDELRGGPMSPEKAATILHSVARALHYAHERNIIHRDIKPANVLLTVDGVPKVSDFGLAREIERDQSLSQDGAVVGTPGYMAPEQARAAENIGPPADIWGMGAMLYAMLTARAPFVGSNPGESVMMLLREEPVPPSKLRLKVPADLETICLKCLEKDISRRYSTAADLANDLDRFLRGEPIAARPISRTERLTRWCKRNPNIAIPSGLAASLGLALAIGGPLAALTINQQKSVVEKTNGMLADSEEQERAARLLAQQNEQIAVENVQLANMAQSEAVVAKESAERSAESASAGYKQAVDALKSLVFGVLRKLEDRPGMSDVREELLATAREGLERLDSTALDPTQNNIIAAGTLRRLGDANLETGRVEAARQCYQRCLEIVSDLDSKNQLPGRFHNLSTAHDLLGQSLKQLGQLPAAKIELNKALDLRRQWLAENPNDNDIRQNVAATLGSLAFVEMDLGDLDAAEKLFDESVSIRRDTATANTFSMGVQLEFLGAKWSLEKLRFRRGDVEQAVKRLEPISVELDALAQANPFQVAPAWNAALAKRDLAQWNLFLGNSDAAKEMAKQSVDKLRELRSTETKNFRLDESLASALYLLAVCDDSVENAAVLDESIELRRRVADADPAIEMPRILLATTLARAGKADEAESLLSQLMSPKTAQASWWHSIAVANAALVRLGDHPSALDRGIQAIKSGIDAGQMPDAIMKRDPELEPLRESDQWLKLKIDDATTVAAQ